MDRKSNHKFWLAIWVVVLAVGQTTYLEASNGPYASNPDPADGDEIYGEPYPEPPAPQTHIWTMLIFEPGGAAVKHTGYFSDKYEDVANRIEDANLGEPPFPYPGWDNIYFAGNPEAPPAIDTLVRGTTYYWCVDETDGNNVVWQGPVWSFYIQSYYSTSPNPPNEAININPDVLLCWRPGLEVDFHDVYLGTSWEAVNNADRWDLTGIYQGWTYEPNWPCSGLPTDTKFYWRVDEYHESFFEDYIYKGDVWSFTTIRREATVLDPADGELIYGEPYPEPPAPQTHIWTMLVFEPGVTAVKHTGYFSDDYSKVYYRHQDANLGEPPFSYPGWDNIYFAGNPDFPPAVDSLVRGTTYYWTVDERDAQGNTIAGEVWEFTIRDFKASFPNPPNEAININPDVLLCWQSGLEVDFHVIYFSTSFDDVNNGYYDPTMVMPPPPWTQPVGDEDWDPVADGGLTIEFGTTYYWRVDEFDERPLPGTGTIYKGDVWSFTTTPQRIFVDIDANGANNGSSWADAFNHLQDALSMVAAHPEVEEIRVAQGIYTPAEPNGNRGKSFNLNNITLRGGFAGCSESEPNIRNVNLYRTILSGDLNGDDGPNFANNGENSHRVVHCDGTVYIDGLTISGGNAFGGSKVGAGLHTGPGCQLTAMNCVFSRNIASVGAGMYTNSGNITLVNCLFIGNYATSEGGGIYGNPGNLTLINCTLCDNIGGGMNGNPWYTYVTLTNCIFSNNGGTSEYEQIGRGIFTINYSCIQGWTGNLGGIGNIDVDPCFVEVNNGDYHLKSQAGRWDPNSESWVKDDVTSPCIDVGKPNSDWTAELWPHGKRINMGAYGGTPEASMSQLDIGNIANLDNDVNDIVNSLDLALFVGKWCYEEFLLAEDLNRDGFVNFNDFSIFGGQWRQQTED